jgi:septum formation protein
VPELILASTSPYRRQLLARLGVPFTVAPPGVEEAAFGSRELAPSELAVRLARAKACAVAHSHPRAIVIGSDQLAWVDGRPLGKPGSAPAAAAQLRLLAGREHTLTTAVAIAHPGGLVEFADTAVLAMRALADDEIDRYVAADQPLDCAGSYRIEGLGIALFARIECGDHSAILGLPLLRLAHELRALGLRLP